MMSILPSPKTNLLLVFFVLFCSRSANAMGSMAHQLVCQLAFDHLSNEKQQVLSLKINQIPISHKRRINAFLHKPLTRNINFSQSCVWADAIKKDHGYDHFKAWHYINVPRNITKVLPEYCDKHCIIDAIPFHQKQYLSTKDSWRKLQALLFLSHWYGDIHQPFHVSYASDLGGNKTSVQLNSAVRHIKKCDNMHWIWDECLLNLPQRNVSNESLKKNYTNIQKLWEKTPQNVLLNWQNSTVLDMATESLSIVRTPSVQYCQLTQGICVPIIPQKNLPTSYYSEFHPVLTKRLLQAAVRLNATLVHLLNEDSI